MHINNNTTISVIIFYGEILMNIIDYFKKGQRTSIEIELQNSRTYFEALIEEIKDDQCRVKILDDSFLKKGIEKGLNGILWGKKGGFKYSVNVDMVEVDGLNAVLVPVQSRSHLRVDCLLIVDFKKITEDDYKATRTDYIHSMKRQSDEYFLQSSQYSTREIESISSDVSPDITAELQQINKKLDFIIKMLMKTDKNNIFNKKPVEVNLSGSGIKIKTSEEYQEDDYLAIKLVLPLLSGVVIDVIGQVVRSVPLENNIWELAIHFAAINEDDKDMIIRYVFKRQRELLRARDDIE